MQISLKKYAHKYEYLKLELEETQEKVTNYTKLWNTEIGKFYLDFFLPLAYSNQKY